MLNKIYKVFFPASVIILPLFASAVLEGTESFLGRAFLLVNSLIPIVFSLAVLLFFWGVAKYIWSAGTGKEEGKRIMVWGIVALFVMSSVWGLVSFLRGELGIGANTSVSIPTIGN
jgi:hypothetical protein